MATQPSKPSPEVLAKLKQLREQFAAKAEMERRRRQAQDNWEQSDTYKRQYPQGEADGGRVPSLDEMRLAITKAKGGLAKFLENSKVKDVLYRGGIGHKELNKDFLEGKSRSGYATFASTSPHVASSYANTHDDSDETVGGIAPLHINVHTVHEFPTTVDRHGSRKFDKFAFDRRAQSLEPGHALVARQVYDQGPRASKKTDPKMLYSYPSDIYAWNNGTETKSALSKAKGGSVEPKSTVKAYKLFRVHPDHPGKLFPLFVDANTPVEMNKWVDAKEGEMANGKVKSKIGALAYRPGWHAGDLPIATHIGEKSDPKLTAPDRRPANHAWAEVEMPDDVDWQAEANKRGTNAQGKVIPVKAHITDQIPKGGHYRYKTNPNMTGNWLIGGSMKVNKVLTDAEVARINKAAGISDLPRAEPFKKKAFGFAHGGVTHAHHLEIEERPL